MDHIDVAVVGGGQAGLAVSYELTQRGVEHVVLERGRIGQTWRGRWDSFCLVTPNWYVQLPGHHYRGSDPDGFMPKHDLVSDWEGGTRIGESLKQLLDRYSQTVSIRSAVVVLCSDGLERGDPDVLAEQMARLGRLAHKVIWVNPLKGDPRYEPLARGMAAALPHIDIFLSGHNIASLEALAVAVGS